MDGQAGNVFRQRSQREPDIDGPASAQLADRLADVGQQQPGQGVGLGHVLQRPPLGQVAGNLQVQAERGQVMTQQVVQLARDPGALIDPRALGQQQPGRLQFGIQPALLLARLRLLHRHQRGDKHKAGKPRVQQGLQQGDQRRKVPRRADEHRDHRDVAGHQPAHADPQRQQPRQQSGHDHQQDAAQSGAGEVADAQRTAGQDQQQKMVDPGAALLAQRAGDPPVHAPEAQVHRQPAADHQIEGRPVRAALLDTGGVQEDRNQPEPDHAPGEQPGVAQQSAMVKAFQHSRMLPASRRSRIRET